MEDDLAAYFWARVNKTATCWLWTGPKQSSSSGFYGRLTPARGNRYAHRVAFEDANGPVPQGWHVDHLCRTTLCVRPSHLQAVTPRVNILRGVGAPAQNARLVVARCGHPFTMVKASGARLCEPCYRKQYRDRYKALQDDKERVDYVNGIGKCGHPFDAVRKSGVRFCRACVKAYNRKYVRTHPRPPRPARKSPGRSPEDN